jgi:nuclear pore complex protein Nup210
VGIVVGKTLGFTRITVRSIGVHPKTGEKVIYAEDTVDINVIKMTGIKIAAPLTKFKTGGTVPVWVTGIPETISPLILSSFEDSTLTYEWYFKDYDVTTIIGVFSTVGVIYKTCDRTIIRITGLQPGKTRLMVNVTFTPVDAAQPTLYHSGVDLEVFEPLILIKPKHMSGKSLLMARHSSIQLETNLDGMSQLEFSIPELRLTGTEVSAVNSTPVATITVTETGHLQSYGTIGFAQLVISATDELGLRQTLTYVVEVKAVHYMLLTVKANWRIHLDSSLQVIPLGTEFDLVANFYDTIGNKFNAGPRQVKVRANRLDLVKIKQFTTNATVQVATKKEGHTVIKGWTDGVDNTADYVKVHSKEVIKPVVVTKARRVSAAIAQILVFLGLFDQRRYHVFVESGCDEALADRCLEQQRQWHDHDRCDDRSRFRHRKQRRNCTAHSFLTSERASSHAGLARGRSQSVSRQDFVFYERNRRVGAESWRGAEESSGTRGQDEQSDTRLAL